VAVGAKFAHHSVRIVIGADGGVKQVHVIRATADQRPQHPKTGCAGGKFKPLCTMGACSRGETGLVFEFSNRPEGEWAD